jgi:DNA invertase Pin-like site-specific DNA recombinase
MTRYVAYIRVSTPKQEVSGLGLEAQSAAIDAFVRPGKDKLIDTVREIETGTNKRKRPELARALSIAKRSGATLLIAKVDRLARNVHFISGLIESKVPFICCDRPDAKPFELHIYAAMAEEEARQISARVKAALMAAKARGVRLGTPANLKRQDEGRINGARSQATAAATRAHDLRDVVEDIRASGITSIRRIADELNEREIVTPSGGRWAGGQVQRLLRRLDQTRRPSDDCARPAQRA